MTIYNNALIVKQAFSVADFDVSDYFPIVGDTVVLKNKSTDNDTNNWSINDGLTPVRNSTELDESVAIEGTGSLIQTLQVDNTVGSDTHVETIYGMDLPGDAYYNVTVSDSVCRVGDTITITPVLLYPNSNSHTLTIDILDSSDDSVYHTQSDVTGSIDVVFDTKGSFDIVLTSNTNGSIVVNKQFKIISVTPALQSRESATVVELKSTEDAYNELGTYYNTINTASPGDTIIIKQPDTVNATDKFRLRLEGLHGTAENPIIITIDQNTQMVFEFESWWGILVSDCSHIILDGKGYGNLTYGIHVTKHPDVETAVTGIQVGNGTTDIQTHNIEFSGSSFAGMVCKTDPNPNNPQYWRGNFFMRNTILHNCYFHDTRSEGIYYGYYNTSTKTGTNSSGDTVTYRAHELVDTKIYRNKFIRCGWDSLQLNNATGATEIHDNIIEDSAVFGEPDQNTGMSLGIEGKIYNNTINGCNGLGIQVGALGPLDIYNNTINNINEGSVALFLLSTSDTPEQNTNGNTNNIPINIYNNNFITKGLNSTVGAQNVAQYENVIFKNNVYTADKKFTGQDSATIALWEDAASNNIKIIDADMDQYKFGSIIKSNFNIYNDSVLATGGDLIGSMYDIRGFKNWSVNDKFIGSYAGITKLPEAILELLSVSINNEAETTKTRNVDITFTFKGNPTEYMISEDNAFIGASWQPYTTTTIPYTLSAEQGDKTVYLKFRNATTETDILYDTISYNESRRFLVNLNKKSVYAVPEGWNDFDPNSVVPIPVGLQLLDLIDQYGEASNLYLTVTAPFDDYASNYNTDNTYPYDPLVVRYNWEIEDTTGKATLELRNCDNGKLYNIILYTSVAYTGANMLFSVNNVDQPYNADNRDDFSKVVSYIDVSPVGGVITIDIKSIGEGASIGLLDITEK